MILPHMVVVATQDRRRVEAIPRAERTIMPVATAAIIRIIGYDGIIPLTLTA
jgi:hypothetical protein